MAQKIYDNISTSNRTENTYRRYIKYRKGNVGLSHSVPRDYNAYEIKIENVGNDSYFRDQLPIQTSYDFFLSRLLTQNERNIAHNRLIGKLREAVGPRSSFGTSIFAEGGEAVSMIADSLTSAAETVRAIRRKDLSTLKRRWTRPRRVQEAMAEAGGAWLQFSWGWQPMVSTIHQLMKVLAQNPEPKIVTVAHKTRASKSYKYGVSSVTTTEEVTGSLFQKVSYAVEIDNGNTWMLNSLDLLSPQVWVWEAIPFSWLADYFVQVGDFLGGLNSFAGLNMRLRYYSSVLRCNINSKTYYFDELRGAGVATQNNFSRDTSNFSPDMKLTFNLNNPLTSSVTRGLNASAFLATRLRWQLPHHWSGWYPPTIR